ncbi:uncharacterized protein LOC120473022 [Pimephales promelas]|uniref:uncharacterized protein LOC120473022 n=1 Tax=Pimephales promelas TaxID=90988 RepID=UPI001955C969|nr:uncharacterized protein LOC120473022 [Pimephales promelas]
MSDYSEGEEDDIRLKLRELSQKHDEAMATLESLKGGCNKTFVYVPRERHISPFTGDIEKDGRTVDEFIDEVERALRARNMTPNDECDFVMSLLRGAALEEVRLRSNVDTDISTDILTYLREAFTDRRSSAQLLQDFYSRKQKEGEDVRDFSHALAQALSQITKRAPEAVGDEKTMLRDQFVEGIRDHTLRRELRRYVRDKPESSMVEVREEAYLWGWEEQSGRVRTPKSRSATYGSYSESAHCAEVKATGQNPVTLSKVMDVVTQQGRQILELTQAVNNLMTQQQGAGGLRNNTRAQLRFTEDGKPICLKCQEAGHIARNCPQKRNAKRPASRSIESGNVTPGLL